MKVFILLGLALIAQSSLGQTGSWISGDLNDKQGQFVGTGNDGSGLLMQHCYYDTQKCYWSMSNGTTNCTPDESYPALVNSEAGAMSIDMYCYKAGGKSRMTFTNFEQIDSAIKKSRKLAVVVPLANGSFTVTRFDLNGANAAIATMQKSFLATTKNSTKDQTL